MIFLQKKKFKFQFKLLKIKNNKYKINKNCLKIKFLIYFSILIKFFNFLNKF